VKNILLLILLIIFASSCRQDKTSEIRQEYNLLALESKRKPDTTVYYINIDSSGFQKTIYFTDTTPHKEYKCWKKWFYPSNNDLKVAKIISYDKSNGQITQTSEIDEYIKTTEPYNIKLYFTYSFEKNKFRIEIDSEATELSNRTRLLHLDSLDKINSGNSFFSCGTGLSKTNRVDLDPPMLIDASFAKSILDSWKK